MIRGHCVCMLIFISAFYCIKIGKSAYGKLFIFPFSKAVNTVILFYQNSIKDLNKFIKEKNYSSFVECVSYES